MRRLLASLALASPVLAGAVTACIASAVADVALLPARFSDLPGWRRDNLADALPAWQRSCRMILARPPGTLLGPAAQGGQVEAWWPVCAEVMRLPADSAVIRRFVENRLTPYRVIGNGQSEGLFTGYYEPVFKGSPTRSGAFPVPLHALPDGHVTVPSGGAGPTPGSGVQAGRLVDGQWRPWPDRAAIQAGALDDVAAVLLWMADPLDAFVLHVQGSGIIEMPDGRWRRVGYAGHNGFDYVSIGRWLIDQGALPAHQASFDDIRLWLRRNPTRAADVLAVNPRYIFFRDIDARSATGTGGVALTAGRSLAVDTRFVPLGVPLWLDVPHPDGTQPRLNRLMLAQDTGNAIRGPVRGDFFWGTGSRALARAGRMKSRGGYFLLLPGATVPVAAR